jgi:hypothetical protein
MKRPMILIPILIVLLSLAACSAAATQAPSVAPQATAYQMVAEKPGEPMVAATMAPLVTAAPVADSGSSNATSPLAYSAPGSGMVIKDAELNLLVRDTSQAVSQVTGLLAEEGGYIINSQTWYQDNYMYASLRLGIPSARFEESLNALRRIGIQVLSENAVGQDVSDQYVDLQSRLTNLEATAARVREFLKDAKTIEDSLRINQQLSDLEAQIEQVKGQMRYFEGRSAFSTVTVSLTPQYPTPTPTITATATATPTLTPTPTAWSASTTYHDATKVLTKEAQGLTDTVIWIGIIAGPWMLLAALFIFILRRPIMKMFH